MQQRIPEYAGATAFRVNDDHLMQYCGKTDLHYFTKYLSALEEASFCRRFERMFCGNYYYTYAAESAYVHLYYLEESRTARVIYTESDAYSLPEFAPERGVDLSFPSTVTQGILDYYYYDENDPRSRPDGNFGAFYLVTLDNGSLLVYDGGGRWGKDDKERVWQLINKHGSKNAEGKIEIAAWIITHEHVDHFWCMHHAITDHADELSLKEIYCTPISKKLIEGHSPLGDTYIGSENALPSLKLIRMHTGQIFYIRNAAVEVLCSPEDIFPEYTDSYCDFNDTTVATRISLCGKTFLNLGDAYHVSSHVMIKHWGKELKSDYCTLAHHGWGGCTRELYDLVAPEKVFVPFSKKWLDRILNETAYISDSGKTKLYIQWAINRYGDFHKITQHVFFDLLRGDKNRFLLADCRNKTLNMQTGIVTEDADNCTQTGYPYGDK